MIFYRNEDYYNRLLKLLEPDIMWMFHKIKKKASEFRHESDFYEAIIHKKIDTLKELCRKHHPNYINYYYSGTTPIHDCITEGFNEGAIELLKNKANPNLPCGRSFHQTALELALDRYAVNINISLIRLLGFYGTKPPSNDKQFKTEEIRVAYQQGRDAFLGKMSIDELIKLENDPLFKDHYIEKANLKIPIHVASVSQLPKLHRY